MEGKIEIATEKDIAGLVKLVNSAYRGESSKQGWTTEADLLGGIRTDEESMRKLIQKEGSVLLNYLMNEQLIGCVNLQKQDKVLYLGMLTVQPDVQAKGIGKALLKAAENYAVDNNFCSIEMSVISIRHELIAWYERRGYRLTGERKPFPAGDPRFGLPKQELEFVVMEKCLNAV